MWVRAMKKFAIAQLSQNGEKNHNLISWYKINSLWSSDTI